MIQISTRPRDDRLQWFPAIDGHPNPRTARVILCIEAMLDALVGSGPASSLKDLRRMWRHPQSSEDLSLEFLTRL